MSDAAMSVSIPAAYLQRRDGLGRLISSTWSSDLASINTDGARWLTAVDGSLCSLRAVVAIVRLVKIGQGNAVDLVNVQSWLSKEAAETQLVRYGWEATEQARGLLNAAGIPWRLHVVMGEDATSIVELADILGSLGICVGSHGLTAAESVLLGSVTCKVLRLAKVPVLIVR